MKTFFPDIFQSGDFTGWSYAQGPDAAQGGPGAQYCYVTTAEKAGIPTLDGVTNIAHFQVPAGTSASQQHAKVYKEWTTTGKKDQWGRVEQAMFAKTNASAIYSAWFYFPANYVPATSWVDIFFFKEQGLILPMDTAEVQNPSWWLNVSPASTFGGAGNSPVLFANNWGTNYSNFHPKTVTLPLGRWCKISAELHQFSKNNKDNRIDWKLDDVLFDTSRAITYPIGTYYHQTNEWIWGVGHYQGIGELYVGNCWVVSLT